MWNLPAAAPTVVDRGPAAGDVRAERPDGDQRSADVDRHLHHVGPDDGGHSALEGIEQRERGDDCDRQHIPRADGDANHNRHREDAHALGRGARQQEEPRGDPVQGVAEAAVDELIGGEHLALEVFWQEEQGHHDAPEHVSDDDLQEPKVAGECQSRRADDGQRGGLGGDDGERNRPPRHRAVGQEVAAQRAIARRRACGRAAGRAMAAETQPEERDGYQVQANHAEISDMQTSRHCLSIAAQSLTTYP